MRVLPPVTQPPEAPIPRRHRPRPAGRWGQYRSCLRWDFGFTCAFCLLHDADVHGGLPGEGLGGTTVEHVIARSTDPSLAAEYENCVYACRWCNRSRSAHPTEHEGVRLLDPTRVAWGDHFVARTDTLVPADGDPDARATHRAYSLDDPRKVGRRRVRRELVSDRLRLIVRQGAEFTELLQLADTLWRRDPGRFGRVMREIRRLRHDAGRALEDLRRYEAVPGDAPRTCRCPPFELSLPEYLDRQLVEVPDARTA